LIKKYTHKIKKCERSIQQEVTSKRRKIVLLEVRLFKNTWRTKIIELIKVYENYENILKGKYLGYCNSRWI
jgi:hypothetical protein